VWYGTGIRVVVTVLSSEMRLINCGNPSEDKGQDIMNISKALMIVLITVGTTLLTEAVCWVLVYSDPGFAKLTTDVEKANKELRRAKERVENDEGDDAKRLKESEKRVAEGEKGVARLNARLTGMRWKTNIIMPFIMIAVFGILGEWYEGSIIAKLPFQPVGFIQGMTRRVAQRDRRCQALLVFTNLHPRQHGLEARYHEAARTRAPAKRGRQCVGAGDQTGGDKVRIEIRNV